MHDTRMRQLTGYILRAVGFSAISGLLFGYDLCVINVAIVLIARDFDLTPVEQESVVSFVMLGALIGCATGGGIAERCGRHFALVLGGTIFTVGAFVMAFAPGIEILLLGRVIVGVAVGATGIVTPVYVAEIAPAWIRGVLVSVNEVMICLGCLFATIVDATLMHSPNGWRWMLGLSAIPSALLLLGMPFLPESPIVRFHVSCIASACPLLSRFVMLCFMHWQP